MRLITWRDEFKILFVALRTVIVKDQSVLDDSVLKS